LPRHPKELTAHSFVSHKVFGGFLKCVNGRQLRSIKIEPRVIADDFETDKLFIMSGDGIGALSPLVCESELARANRAGVARMVYANRKWSGVNLSGLPSSEIRLSKHSSLRRIGDAAGTEVS
jgi:hypothetical protein